MSEYIMNHTGGQLDEAIDKVLNEYIKPEGTLNITEKDNNTEVDVTRYALAKVQIPIPTFKTTDISIEPQEGDPIRRTALEEGCNGFSEVVVSPISSTYVGSGVPTKGAETFTPKKDVQQVIPKGRFLTGDQIIDKIPDNYIIPINLTADLLTRTDYDVASAITIPAGYFTNEAITISEWATGQMGGSGTAGDTYKVPISSIGFTPKYGALITNSDNAKAANVVLAVFGNDNAGRSIYTGSKASLSTTYTINTGAHKPICDSSGITFPSISSTKYITSNYRWFAFR